MSRLAAYSLVTLGVMVSLSGAVFIFFYVYDGIILPWKRSDQSLLFWYLPILFIGFLGGVLGISLWGRGLDQLRTTEKES